MKCTICGIEVETIDDAILDDWLPYFYEGDVEHGPVCSGCAKTMIDRGDDGEMELKAEYHGKIRYMDGDYSDDPKREEVIVKIIMTEEKEVHILTRYQVDANRGY